MGPGSTRSPSQSVHPQGLQEATGPTLAPEARYGLAGDVVRALEPHTEADPAGLLCNFLAGFGNLVGPGPHYLLGAEPHPPRLNVLVVGATARSRKGTSWSAIAQVLEQADPGWAERRIKSGLASGEALVQAVRDETRNRAGELVDAGEPDKRLLVLEPEFVRVLAVAGRDGSTLSSHLREAWDKHGRLENLTKSDQVVVRRSHISILGQITREELLRRLTDTEAANGFANRFLFVSVRRARLLPEPEPLDHAALDALAERVQGAAEQARKIGAMHASDDAREYWAALYPEIEGETGLGGLAAAVTARAAAQVRRLSVVYALLDGSAVIDLPHLQAGYAVWRYSEASALEIFGDALGDEVADQLLADLRAAGEQGRTLDQQRRLFHGHVSSERLTAARARLERAGLARTVREKTKGGPRRVTYATARSGISMP